ncbi:MAG: amidohydrolase family protein [Candidatus Deferrimicrobiaceae bacterium]
MAEAAGKFRNVPVLYVASCLVPDASKEFSPGAVAVADGLVVAAGTPADVERRIPAGFNRLDLPGLAIIPGIVNAHTHLSIPRMAGREDTLASFSLSFMDWILLVIEWKRNAPPGEFRRNVEAAAREATSGGTTAVGEIAGPDSAVYASLPLRSRVFVEGIGFHPEVAGPVLSSVEEALGRIDGFSRAGVRIAPGISPHTLYTCGPGLLRSLAQLGERRNIPLALHLAESPAEMAFLASGEGEVSTRLYPAVGKDVSFFRGLGEPIPAYLRKAGILREGLVLVHNVHLSRREIDDLHASGAKFVLCPRSNAAHRNGSPDVTHFLEAGIPFALGTDSLGSVATMSMWEEMREAAGLYRGGLSPEEMGRALFRAATENGARALGFPSGRLLPGAPADFAAVDLPGGRTGEGICSRLVDRGEEKHVRLTVIAGERMHERP